MSTKTATKVRVSNGNGNGHVEALTLADAPLVSGNTVDDVKAMVTAHLEEAYKEAISSQKSSAEIADPGGDFAWDVLGFGPIELGAGVFPFAGPPYLPNQVIRVGDTAVIVTVLVFSPQFTTVLTPFQVPYEIKYRTGDLTNWVLAPAEFQGENTGQLAPNVPFVVDVFEFTPTQAGIYELNISAQILDATGGTAPPFSGFARRIQKIEPLIFLPEEDVLYDTGIKFQVYEN